MQLVILKQFTNMKKIGLLILFGFIFSVNSNAQNLQHVAFDTNGPVGECLFPQNEDGDIVFSDIVECEFSADTIMGLAKEFIYSIQKKYNAKTSNLLEGITKVACDLELKIGKKTITVGRIGTWEKEASTINFNLVIDIRKGKYRYTLTDFVTDRYRIPGDGKDQGPSNMIHWQRVNSLTREMGHARKGERDRYQAMINFEDQLYHAEYDAIQDVIDGLKKITVIEDDF